MELARACVRSLCIAALLLLVPYSSKAQQRVALVIAIDDYSTLTKLNNSVRDGRAIASILRAGQFSVRELYDATLSQISTAIDELRHSASNADVAVVYFAGHGLELDGRNIIAPSDMSADCDKSTWRGMMGLDALFQAIRSTPKQIVILDACRDNPVPSCPNRGGQGGGFRNLGDLARNDASVLVANSTLSGRTASDGRLGEHSPFARALISRLREQPSLPIREVLDRVAGDVQRETRRQQVPETIVRGVSPQVCLASLQCGIGTGSDRESPRVIPELTPFDSQAQAPRQNLKRVQPIPFDGWTPLPTSAAGAIVSRVPLQQLPIRALAKTRAVSFYPTLKLLSVADLDRPEPNERFYLYDASRTIALNWTNEPIYRINETSTFTLNNSTAIDYARFFFHYVRGQLGRFIFSENINQVPACLLRDTTSRQQIASKLEPLRLVTCPQANLICLQGTTIFKSALFRTKIFIATQPAQVYNKDTGQNEYFTMGQLKLVDEELLLDNIPSNGCSHLGPPGEFG